MPGALDEFSPPPASPKGKTSNKPTETGGKLSKLSLFGLLFDPEYGGDMFLRNVGFSPNYTAFTTQQLD
jgi:hypothetical protein